MQQAAQKRMMKFAFLSKELPPGMRRINYFHRFGRMTQSNAWN
jgi:hypothetical protein